MKAIFSKRIRQAAFIAVCTWGLLSLLFVSGEPTNEEMAAGHFALLKIAGLLSLTGAIMAGRRMERKGWITFNANDDIA